MKSVNHTTTLFASAQIGPFQRSEKQSNAARRKRVYSLCTFFLPSLLLASPHAFAQGSPTVLQGEEVSGPTSANAKAAAANNSEEATDNSEQATDNSEQATDNSEQATEVTQLPQFELGAPLSEEDKAAEKKPSSSLSDSTQSEASGASKVSDSKASKGPWHKALRRLRIFGLAQIDFQHRQISQDELAADSREPLNENLFHVRNAQIGAENFWGNLGGRALLEFFGQEGKVRPLQFEGLIRYPNSEDSDFGLQFRAGLFPIPFGQQSYDEGDSARFFAERSLFVEALTPGRFDLGAGIEGWLDGFHLALAVQNGEPVGAEGFAYRDPNSSKDIAGRLRYRDQFGPVKWGVGTSILWGKGFSPGTPPSKDSFEWRDLNEDGRVLPAELIPIPGSAGRSSENFERWATGVDLQLDYKVPKLGPLRFVAELAIANNFDRKVAPSDPVLFGRDQRSLGYSLALTQKFGPWLSGGFRYDSYEPNADEIELFGGVSVITSRSFEDYIGSLHIELPKDTLRQAHFLVEYQHQKNTLGRDNQGRPAQLDNDSFRLRLQMAF